MKLFNLILFSLLLPFCLMAGNFPDKKLTGELDKQLGKKKYTIETIQLTENSSVDGMFMKVITGNSKQKVSYAYQGTVKIHRGHGNQNESAEYFDYYILFDRTISIQKVSVTNYEASHGEMICSQGWLNGFIGYNSGKMLEIGKQLDAISGATLSVNKLSFDVKQKTALLTKLTQK